MNEGIAIIIAAGIAIGGIALTQLFNYLQRKADFKEHVFFDAYQKRLALYEDVVKALAVIGKPEADLLKMSKQEFSDKALGDYHTLLILSNRLRLYGSPGARDILVESVSRMKEICMALAMGPHFSDEIEIVSNAAGANALAYVVGSFILLVNDSLSNFTKLVCEETGTNFVDKRISEIQKEIAKEETDKKPGGDSNPKI